MRVLIVGDSMTHRGSNDAPSVVEVTEGPGRSGSPGDLLVSWLLSAGATAARIDAKVGRSAHSLFRVEPGDQLLAADRAWAPDLVIVMLGTNDLGLNREVDKQDMMRIRDAFPGAEIWGIGPPDFADPILHKQTGPVVAMMRDVFGPRFLDVRPLTQDLLRTGRASDGVHFVGDGAKIFGYRLALSLLRRRRTAWLLPLAALGPWGQFAYDGLVAWDDRKARTATLPA